jgi:hypothetical protein
MTGSQSRLTWIRALVQETKIDDSQVAALNGVFGDGLPHNVFYTCVAKKGE